MDALDLNGLFLWRALERLATVLVAAGSIYLGYRLFWSLKEFKNEGEAKIQLPGGISIFISRVGPGIFFALFGTAIIGFSITQPMTLNVGGGGAPATNVERPVASAQVLAPVAGQLSYATDRGDTKARFSRERANLITALERLNALEPTLEAAQKSGSAPLKSAQATPLRIALPRLRRALLLRIWDEQWGNPDAFEAWIKNGDPENPPAAMAQPARLYLGK